MELIHRDLVNVAYIIKLLVKLKQAKISELEKQKKAIMDLLGSEVQLHSKRELIEKFIEENLPKISDVDSIQDEFENLASSSGKVLSRYPARNLCVLIVF